jgi:hypothetical protein
VLQHCGLRLRDADHAERRRWRGRRQWRSCRHCALPQDAMLLLLSLPARKSYESYSLLHVLVQALLHKTTCGALHVSNSNPSQIVNMHTRLEVQSVSVMQYEAL